MAPSAEMRFSGCGIDADAGVLSGHVVEWLEQRFGGPLSSPTAPPDESDGRLM